MRNKNGSIISMVLGLIIFTGVILFVFVLFSRTKKESEIIINEASFEIKGMYGNTYDFDTITQIELHDVIPNVIRRDNGAGLGEIKKGHFTLEEFGKCRLFVHVDHGPYIVIISDGNYVIINLYTNEDTTKLYQDLLGNWQNIS